MAIKDIPNIKFITPAHRAYEYILDFVVATCSFGSYFKIYHNQAATTFAPINSPSGLGYPNILFEGKASKRSVSFIPHELFTDIILNNARDSKIAYLEEPSFKQIVGVYTDAVTSMFEGFTNAMFIRYYEESLEKIRILYSNNQDHWPEVLRFSRVVRNCMSHGGKIDIRNPKFRPVSHFGLSYTFTDNGKRLLHETLTPADIFFLVLEMELAF